MGALVVVPGAFEATLRDRSALMLINIVPQRTILTAELGHRARSVSEISTSASASLMAATLASSVRAQESCVASEASKLHAGALRESSSTRCPSGALRTAAATARKSLETAPSTRRTCDQASAKQAAATSNSIEMKTTTLTGRASIRPAARQKGSL